MTEPVETPENQDPPEITLETIAETSVEELNDDQKSFIQEHAEELTDEQKETYKEVLDAKEEEEDIDPEKVEPETRTPAQKKKDKEKEEESEDEDEDDDEVDPDDEAKINKIVDKRVGSALKEVEQIKNRTEVDAFINAKPEFGRYREVAIKYMNHPAYANIPVHNIMAIVASKDLQKLGAEKERQATKKANDTKNAGGTVREPGKGKTDWSKASKDDFNAQRAKVLGQQG